MLNLSTANKSLKLLVTTLLCMVGLIYLTLLAHIFIDTEMKPSIIAQGYGGMEYIELTDHAHNYLPYYTIFIFMLPVILFMFTSFSENLKRFFAVFPFIIIIIDIASMFLIPYVWSGFAYVLWIAGTILGLTFTTLFILINYDIWFNKNEG